MRHRKAGLKLNRTSSHRKAMFRNMVTSLLKHDRIQTTDAKAKELKSWADHLITLAKRGDLHARRQALSIVREKNVVHKLFEEANDRFGSISGGYTRVVKLGRRRGDAAPVSIIELVAAEKSKKKKTKKKKTDLTEKPLAEETAAAEATPAESDEASEADASPEKTAAAPEVEDESAVAASEAEDAEASAAEADAADEAAAEDSPAEEAEDPEKGDDTEK